MKENCFVPVAFSIFLIIMKAFDKKSYQGMIFRKTSERLFLEHMDVI